MMNILFFKGEFFLSMLDSDWVKCLLVLIIFSVKIYRILIFWFSNIKVLYFSLRKGFLY